MSSPNGRQVVVVTGASAGIGRATVLAFARRGASIGLLARGRAGLEGARRKVEEAGGSALVLPTDVADPAQIEAAAAAVEERLGPIDVWVNNAMVSVFSPVNETTPEEFRRVTEVTYLGAVYGTLAALARMLPRDRGVVDVARAFLVENRPHRDRIGTGAQIYGDVKLATEPAVRGPRRHALRELRLVDEAAP